MDIVKILNSSRIILKSIVILVMILLLNLPMFKIDKLIFERESRSEDVKKEFHQEWGGEQVITAPAIKIPYQYATSEDLHYYYLTPEQYNVEGEIFAQKKHRGIFEMPLFKSTLSISGEFNTQKLIDFQEREGVKILWENAKLFQRMTEYSHLNKRININWAGEKSDLKLSSDYEIQMLSSPVRIDSGLSTLDFSFNLNFNGSEKLAFAPIATSTNVHLTGEWNDVSYIGMTSEESNENGVFSARWTKMNQVDQDWFSSPLLSTEQQFGARLLMANDHYNKSHRATKYAFLLISLTYVAFFFIELISKRNIHPLQYALVGLALCLFYVLLVSFSEQLEFNVAYIISTIMTAGLISWYTLHILSTKQQAFFMLAMQLIVYGFVFMILQMQDYALIAGSVGLFAILGALMYFSKKIDFSKETQSID